MRTNEARTLLNTQHLIPLVKMEDISVFQMDTEHKKFTIDDVSSGLRRLIFQKCKQVRPTGIFINEYLTKHRHDVMYGIHQLKNTYPKLKKKCFPTMAAHSSLLRAPSGQSVCLLSTMLNIGASVPANVGPPVSVDNGLPPLASR